MEFATIIIRFLITFTLSLIFGLERQKSHKPIGFGTFILVAVGSCGLALTAISLYPENPLPLLSAIVTGIGFLGAGALIRTTDKIFGSTTAASIWVFAIFGLIIGVGNYLAGIILYALIWAIIFFDKYLEEMGIGSYRRRLMICTNKMVDSKELNEIFLVGIKKYHLITTEVDKKGNKCCITYLLEGSKSEINKLTKKLYDKEWCDSVKIE